MRSLSSLVAVAALTGCLAPAPTFQTQSSVDAGPDGGVPTTPFPPPVLGQIPSATPDSSVAITGTSSGQTVVVVGSVAVPPATVLPSGEFCVDVPLLPNQTANLMVYALSGDGRFSVGVPVTVQQSASAPEPPSPTCSGQQKCNQVPVCQSGANNCDGLLVECDPQCNGCRQDAYAPNASIEDAAWLNAGTYSLQLCPCLDEWFKLDAALGVNLSLSASFDQTQLGLSLSLLSDEGDAGVVVVATASGAEPAAIDVPDAGGVYYVHVSAGQQQSGSYQLTVQ